MIQKWLVNLAVSFMMRQLAKWGEAIDWPMVKADVEARVRALVPGTWLDNDAVALMMSLVDAAAGVLAASGSLEKIVKLVIEGKIQEAWEMLRDLILGSFVPVTEADKMMVACVEDCPVIAA